MLIIPAIDLKDGKVVRLWQGDFSKATVYGNDPGEVARRWADEGAERIHVVDLDAARTGVTHHLDQIREIAQAVDVDIEAGGGLRSPEQIEAVFEAGVRYAVVGTKATQDSGFLKAAVDAFGDRLIVGLDAMGGKVMKEGWAEESGKSLFDLAAEVQALGVKTVIYTDIACDGTLRGPQLETLNELLIRTKLGVIASGGVSTLDDLKELKKLEPKGLVGAISGRALYENRFTLREALKEIGPWGSA
ncbi:MAG: 1-(5-phosphoribosyl)-5-[(5-phosphoribosylamino)methylideneamino]imidazole-4-carboxamide isomerase [Candidatus Omnitrophica bacterium]|nr:1-(5-phosphoribosyl)-5-[(5-phosphoribosylamino)methylideneamino]imidazole-4-carboxamide isomerase [Candidatus Omnitrophota bacterium]